ncbi:MAG: hypothetical protein JNM85_08945 [Chthonomonas sp.]|nr:hypothetical protein [Chthonomonas sp.]
MLITSLTAALLLTQTPRSISELLPTNFKTATFVTKKVSANQKELATINKDFGMSYRFDSMTVSVKEPHKLRLEAKVQDSSFLFIVNGTTKLVRAPRAKISIKDDVSTEPGKRQTVFDFGILTPALMQDLFTASFVRMDRETGDAVYDLFYKSNMKDATRHRVWISPSKKVITKREWYSQFGDKRLMATMIYGNFTQKGGGYFPTVYTVKSASGKVAGVLEFERVTVNEPLADSLFSVN